MKHFIALLLTLSLSACNLTEEIPSFYDDNESKAVVDLALEVRSLNCDSQLVKHHVNKISRDLDWLITYTELKGTDDVYTVLMVVEGTLEGMKSRKTISTPYCELKKKNLITQTDAVAKAVFRRY